MIHLLQALALVLSVVAGPAAFLICVLILRGKAVSRKIRNETPRTCTVGELIAYLAELPISMPVAFQCYSQYYPLEIKDISVADLKDNGGYLSHVWRGKDQPLANPHVCFPGN